MSSFRLSNLPIDTAELHAALGNFAAGGYSYFEGRVRDHNDGRAVERLEYEAFEALALAEGERIMAEARERFALLEAACVHRVGALELGELAVWIGVGAAHRDAAFAACRYIIDEVKHRLPIWKKEFYVNGKAEWINCQRCASELHAVRPDSTPLDETQAQSTHAPFSFDYSRQTALRELGTAGQQKLLGGRVLVIGAGGLGVAALSYLAGAGVGTITIVDGDALEASNLHRQPMYGYADIGKPKAELAAARSRAINPQLRIHALTEHFTRGNAVRLVEDCDVALDCSDNFTAKFLLSDACVSAGKPAIFASVYQYEGQLQVFRPDLPDRPDTVSACLRCLWPQGVCDGAMGNCAQAGVLGPVPGVLGTLQALEAIKLLAGLPGQLCDEVLILDLLALDSRKLRASRHPACKELHGMRTAAALACAACTTHGATARSPAAQFKFEPSRIDRLTSIESPEK